MKLKLSVILALCLFITAVNAQTLGEFKPKDVSYGLNKLKGKAKKIYIAGFSVNYQIFNEKEDFKQGGYQLGGGYKGDASAKASVGLDGLSDKDVQEITNKLYADYIAQLKAKGLTIVSADEAAKTETYTDFERLTGGTVSLAQFPGMMSTAPAGYEFFVKKVTNSGKAKSGGFLNNPAMLYPKLSKELGDAIIADVNLYVMFVEDQNAFKGNGANIKIKTHLRLAGQEAIVMASDAKFKMKGQNTITAITSAVNFYHGKMGMGATTSYSGVLTKPFSISDVIEDTKVQSFANRSMDGTGVKTMYGTFFTPENKSSQTTKVIDVDAKKYHDGVYQATKKFIDFHTSQFLGGI